MTDDSLRLHLKRPILRMVDGATSQMHVASSLCNATGRIVTVPERFCGHGVLGDLAAQGGPTAPVLVPFSKEALSTWAEDQEIWLDRVQQEAALWVEVMEVRVQQASWKMSTAPCCTAAQSLARAAGALIM